MQKRVRKNKSNHRLHERSWEEPMVLCRIERARRGLLTICVGLGACETESTLGEMRSASLPVDDTLYDSVCPMPHCNNYNTDTSNIVQLTPDSVAMEVYRAATKQQTIPWTWWGNGVGKDYGNDHHALFAWTDARVAKFLVEPAGSSAPLTVQENDEYSPAVPSWSTPLRLQSGALMPYGFIDYESELWLRRKADGRFLFIGDSWDNQNASLTQKGYCDLPITSYDDEPGGITPIPYDAPSSMTDAQMVVAFAAITKENDIRIGLINKQCDYGGNNLPDDVIIDLPDEELPYPEFSINEGAISDSNDWIVQADHGLETGDAIIVTTGAQGVAGFSPDPWGAVTDDPTLEAFAATAIDTTSDEITVTGHGFSTGDHVYFTKGNTAPAGLFIDGSNLEEDFYIVRTGSNTFRLAHSQASAHQGNYIDITSSGSTSTYNHAVRHVVQDIVIEPRTVIKVADNKFRLAESYGHAINGDYIELGNPSGSTYGPGTRQIKHRFRRAEAPSDRILRNNIAADVDGRIFVVHQHGVSMVQYDRTANTLTEGWTNTTFDVGPRGPGTSPTLVDAGPDKILLIVTSHASENWPRLSATGKSDKLVAYDRVTGSVKDSIDVDYTVQGAWSHENSLTVRNDTDIYIAQYNGLANGSCAFDYMTPVSANRFIVNATGPDYTQQNVTYPTTAPYEPDFSTCISTPFGGVHRYRYDPPTDTLSFKASNDSIALNSVLFVADDGVDEYLYGYGKTLTEIDTNNSEHPDPADLDLATDYFFKRTGTDRDSNGMFILDPVTLAVEDFGDTFSSGSGAYQCENLAGFGTVDCPPDHPQFENTGLYVWPLPNGRMAAVGTTAGDSEHNTESAPIWVFENGSP